MKYFCLIFLILVNCGARKVNQYIKIPGKQARNGLWIEKSHSEAGEVVTRGRYKSGEQVGRWVTKIDGKIYQKDFTKNGITKTTIYWPNGKIMEKGQSKTESSLRERIWYYFGDWKFYDEQGKLKYTKTFSKGYAVDSIAAPKK